MTTGQPDRPAAAMSPPGGGSVAFEDLTARARIREAAIQHFAEEGYERTTIRGIAQTAGVSPGLLRHHFGSKEELRRACDEYVAGMLRQVNAQVLADPGQATAARRDARRYHRYIVRALADGSDEAGPIFDEMVTQTEQWLARADEARPDPPAVDLRIRAALVTAMAAGIPLLHDHVSRALGIDIFEPEGDRLLALGLLDIYSHTLINEETASAAEAGLDLPGQPGSVVAGHAVEEFADRVKMPDVPRGLLEHVHQHPAKGGAARSKLPVRAHVVERMGGDDLVRLRALLRVLTEQPAERDTADPHVRVLRLVQELRVDLGWPVQEQHLEPGVLDPAEVGHHTGHRHQRRGRQDRPVRVGLAHSFALPVDERPLQVKPAGELGTFVRHEGRTGTGQRHEPDVSGAGARTAS